MLTYKQSGVDIDEGNRAVDLSGFEPIQDYIVRHCLKK